MHPPRKTAADNRPTLRELRVRFRIVGESIGSIRGSQSSWMVTREKNQPPYVTSCRLHRDIVSPLYFSGGSDGVCPSFVFFDIKQACVISWIIFVQTALIDLDYVDLYAIT